MTRVLVTAVGVLLVQAAAGAVVSPSFQHSFATITVDENSGPHSIPWATSIAAGATDGVPHTAPEFSLLWANTSFTHIFSAQPAVSLAGLVSFSPAVDKNTDGVTCALYVRFTAQSGAGPVHSCDPLAACPTLFIVINKRNRAPSVTLSQSVISLDENFGALEPPASPLQWSGAVTSSISPGSAPDEASQTVSFAVSVADSSLFAVVPFLFPNGTLQFTLGAYKWGSTTVSIAPVDNGAPPAMGPTVTLTLVVNNMNQPPTATLGIAPTVTVARAAGLVQNPTFLTDVRPAVAAAGESNQLVAVSFITSPSAGVFDVLAADVSGTFAALKMQVAASFWGVCNVTVRVQDNGGTARGLDSTWLNFSVDVPFSNTAPTIVVPETLGIGDNDPRRVVGANETNVTVALFATELSPGAGEAALQNFTIATSTDSPGAFSTSPALSALGTLTFAYPNALEGTFGLSFVVSDDLGLTTTRSTALTISRANRCPTMTVPAGSPFSVAEDAGHVTWPAWITDISPGPTEEVNQTVTFNVSATPASAFAVPPVVLYNASAPNASLAFQLNGVYHGAVNVVLKLTDSGSAVVGCNNAQESFVLNVQSANDSPTFIVMMPTMTVPENSGFIRVPAWATSLSPGDAAEANQTLAFRVEYGTANDVNRFDSPIAVSNASGDLTFHVKTHVNTVPWGHFTFYVILVDSQGAESCVRGVDCPSYSLVVLPNNTAATASLGADVVVWEDRRDIGPAASNGTFTQANWAHSIDVGPGWERNAEGQVAVFATTHNTSNFFSAGPAILSDGTLAFTLVQHANGVANVAVTVADSGADAPVTPIGSFHIHVLPVNDAPWTDRNDSNIPVPLHIDASVIDPLTFHLGTAYAGPPGCGDEVWQMLSTGNCTVVPAALAKRCELRLAPDGKLDIVFERDGLAMGGYIDVTVADNGGTERGGSSEGGFRLLLDAQEANDPPSFHFNSSMFTALQQAVPTPVSVTEWANAITPHRTEEAVQTVSVSTTTTDPALFASAPQVSPAGTLTFTPAQYAVGIATVTSTITDNGVPPLSHTESFQLVLKPVNQCPLFSTRGTVNIDQQSEVSVTIVEEYLHQIWKGPANEAAQVLQFAVVTSDTSMFAVQPSFSLNPSDSTKADLTFAAKPFVNGLVTVTVTAKDDGGIADGGCDTSQAASFNIRIAYANVPPSFDCGQAVLVDENQGAVSVPAWATSINRGSQSESDQSLFFSVSAHDWAQRSLFSAQPSLSTQDGTLTFQTRPDVNTFTTGPILFRVVLYDNGNSGSWQPSCSGFAECCNISVTVRPVNHPPTFVAGPAITVREDLSDMNPVPAGLRYSHPGWASNLYVGTTSEINEQNQTAFFVVTATNTAIFAATPTVFPNGTLSFALAPHRSGTSTVSVHMQDTGATPNQSPVSNFAIVVVPVNDAPVGTLTRTSFTVAENAGAATFANIFTTTGTAEASVPDEHTQTLTTEIVVLNGTDLFSVQPAIDSTGALTFTTAPFRHGTARVLVRLRDNGGTANGGVSTTDFPTSIVIEHVNQVPLFNLRETFVQTVAGRGIETFGSFIGNLTPGHGDELVQSVQLRATARRPELFSVQPQWNATTGDLTFAVSPEAKSALQIDFTATDNGVPPLTSAAATLTVGVNAVNQQPTFSIPLQVNTTRCTASIGPCAKVFRGVATNITAGASSELEQTLTFSVASPLGSLPLFAVTPTMSRSGDLSFTLKPEATTYGDAPVTVTVSLRDNGGTSDGGVDTLSLPLKLQIWPPIPAPTFTLGSDIVVRQDVGRVERTGWVTNVARGGFDVSSIVWSATVSDPGLFAVPPTLFGIGNTADFAATMAANRSGTATVYVTALDSETGVATTHSARVSSTEFVRLPTAVPVSPVYFYQTEAAARRQVLANLAAAPASSIAATNVSCTPVSATASPLFSAAPFMHSPAGDIEATPNPAATGSALCTVLVTAVGETTGAAIVASFTVTLVVQAPNAAPTFALLTQSIIVPQADAVHHQALATAMSPGPAAEAGQALTFFILCANTSVFAELPTVDATNGNIRFVPSLDVSGRSTCTVTLVDNGPGEVPNVNRSTSRSVEITVAHVNRAPSFVLRADAAVQQGLLSAVELPAFVSQADPGHPRETSQRLTATVTAADPTVFLMAPQLSDFANGTTAALRLAFETSFWGTATFTVCVADNGGVNFGGSNNSCATGQVSVQRVNQVPGATFAPQVIVSQTAEPFTSVGWLRSVHAGAGDTDQQVSSAVLACNGSDVSQLMTAAPTVALSTGTLTVWPRSDAAGTATCALRLTDTAGATFESAVAVQVVRANRAPTMVAALSSIVATEGQPARVAAVRSVSPGTEAWEADQVVSLSVAVDPPSAAVEFASYPVVSNTDWMLSFTLRNGTTLQSVSLVISALDNGGTAHGGNARSASLTVTVAVQRLALRPDIYFEQARLSLFEDAGAVTFANVVVGFVPAIHTATFACNATTVPPQPFAVPPALGPNGSVAFTMSSHVHGTIPCVCSVRDLQSGLVTSGTIEIVAVNINDAPSFAFRPNVTVRTGATTVVSGWASQITAGAHEAEQRLTFATAFTAGPVGSVEYIAVDGTSGGLTLRTSNVSGTSAFSVSLRDDGGSLYGGVDESTLATLTVVVVAPVVAPQLRIIGSGDVTIEDFTVRGMVYVAQGWLQYAPAGTSLFAVPQNRSVIERASFDDSGNTTFIVAGSGHTTIDVTALLGADTVQAKFSVTVLGASPTTAVAPAAALSTSAAQTTTVAPLTVGAVVRPGLSKRIAVVDPSIHRGPFTVSSNASGTVFASPPTVASDGFLTLFAATSVRDRAVIDLLVAGSGGEALTAMVVTVVPADTLVRTTLTQDVANFDVEAFREVIAVAAGVSTAQVVIIAVRAGSTVVDFYIDAADWEPATGPDAIATRLMNTLREPTSSAALAVGSIGSAVVPNAVAATDTPTATPTTTAATVATSSTAATTVATPSEEDQWYVSTYVVAAVVVFVVVLVVVVVACCVYRRRRKSPAAFDADDDGEQRAVTPPRWDLSRGHPVAPTAGSWQDVAPTTNDELYMPPVKRTDHREPRPAANGRRATHEAWVDIDDDGEDDAAAPVPAAQHSQPRRGGAAAPGWMSPTRDAQPRAGGGGRRGRR